MFDVYDIWNAYSAQERLKKSTLPPEDWAAEVTEAMVNGPGGHQFQTVLIDEAQDLSDSAFRMLNWQLGEEGTLCVASGKGQELYDVAPSRWLKAFKQHATLRPLRRNFRNTKPVFQLSQTAYEAKLDVARISDTLLRLRFPQTDSEQLRFDREEGQWPRMIYVGDQVEGSLSEMEPAFAHRQHAIMVGHYERILREELDALTANQWPQDLLLLVPNEDGPHRQWAIDAVKRLGEGIHYLDYTDPEQRRVIARPTQVRICTFHSSRGIEGTRVIVFGIELLLKMARNDQDRAANLAYIVLSRSVAECAIVIPQSQARQAIPAALTAMLAALKENAGKEPDTTADTSSTAKAIADRDHLPPSEPMAAVGDPSVKIGARRRPKQRTTDASPINIASLLTRYPPGSKVLSPKFGCGLVKSATLTGTCLTLSIEFDGRLIKLRVPEDEVKPEGETLSF